MKQVVQSLKTGELELLEVPAPSVPRNGILVQTSASLVSAGTERMIIDFAGKNLIEKARARPDLVRQTWNKVQREGILSTWDAVNNRLDQPLPLGYSCAGIVIEAGDGATGFRRGQRVACGGATHAVHAEMVSVPKNLAVSIEDSVAFEDAAFTTVGAIALQGIRLADVKLGEAVAVIGLGLVGQLTVQMLRSAGCSVIGLDLQQSRVELARGSGADFATTDFGEFLAVTNERTSGHGADAVLITADTKSNAPVENAGEVARRKGVVVAVGAVGMTIPRKIYYEKELDFRISMSYGPGRYDAAYEEQGHDYPYAYVRWTEQRNMEAFAAMLAKGTVTAKPLITHRFEIENASAAYELISGRASEPFLGVVLMYPGTAEPIRRVELEQVKADTTSPVIAAGEVRLGVVGAGLFATSTLLPALQDLPSLARIGIASARGLSAQAAGKRFSFNYCASDADEIMRDARINTVAILTRHDTHARQVIAALQAGKNVFVEKPLCLTSEELNEIAAVRREHSSQSLLVGFNRRFAPMVVRLKEALQRVDEPLMLQCRVNAGYIPPDHWLHDPQTGGGRLIGEACHFIDLLLHLAGSRPKAVRTVVLPDSGRYRHDNFAVTIEFENGSIGSVTYIANGDKGFGKELIEVFGGGLSARLDDYRTLVIQHGTKRVREVARLRQDKGHRGEWSRFVDQLVKGGPAPIRFDDIVGSMRATFAANQSLTSGDVVPVQTASIA